MREGTQIEIVGGEIIGRAFRRPADLGGLHCRFDNTGYADGDFVLKIEHVFERAIEAVRPEMCARLGIDQLCGDPNATAGLAHRAFKHVTDPEFTPYLLNIDGLALVGEARIASDDKEPTDSAKRRADFLDHSICEIFLFG